MRRNGLSKFRSLLSSTPRIPFLSTWLARYRVRQIVDGQSSVKLHLGCGSDYLEGYVNIDINSEVHPDLTLRADCLGVFPSNSVDVVESYHLLEHFHLIQARRALREWFRVLKGGGVLVVELPDLARCINTINQYFDEAGIDLAMGGIYGYPPAVDQEGEWQVHKWGWTFESLKNELEAVGFRECKQHPIRQTWRPASRFGRDMQIKAVKP